MIFSQKSTEKNEKELIQTGEPFFCTWGTYPSLYSYFPHWHDYIELLFIRKGYINVTLRNTTVFTMNEGDLLVIMPGELHSMSNDGKCLFENFVIHIESVFFHNAIFDSKELSKIYPYMFNSWTPRYFHFNAEEVKKSGILAIGNRLYTEYNKKELGYTISIRAGILDIFVWLIRKWNQQFKKVSDSGRFSVGVRMQPVLEIIKEHYRENLTTKEMANKMNMSVFHFCRLFKKLTGNNFHNYLQSLRVVESIKLLLSGDESIKKIASMVGYSDENYYIRVFKAETGMTPDKYRKNYRQVPLVPEDASGT